MTSSKYIQLTDKVLMEYEYFNPSESTSSEKKEYQFIINGDICVHNSGTKYIVSNNLTKNNISGFSADNNFYCLKSSTEKKFICLNGNDRNVYATAEEYIEDYTSEYIKLPIIYTQKTTCDKVKIYFTTSYSIDYDGAYAITISSNYSSNNGTFEMILANYNLTSFDVIPSPFLIGEKLYTRVIEFYVPSIKENGLNIFGNNIATPVKIDIKLSKIIKEESYNYLNKKINVQSLVDVSSTSISHVDLYAHVFANIEEVDDYFIFEGSTKNTWKTFNDFISDLPGTASDYILMHDITVNELLPTVNSSQQNWNITTHNIITQTDDFDEPVIFRPVIKYSNTIACVIDYTLRIYCQANNTQIIKRSTYQNFNFAKYGKKMLKINLGTTPPQINVYNKIDNDKISKLNIINANQNMNILQDKIFKTSYITSFRDRMNIKASIAPVKIDNITE